jgi:frataxin-like iron-binding protein CyaY
LRECILWVAVIMNLWVRNGSGLAINEHEPFIEIWAVLKSGNVSTNILNFNCLRSRKQTHKSERIFNCQKMKFSFALMCLLSTS